MSDSETVKTPPTIKDEEKSVAGGSETPSQSASSETPSGQRRNPVVVVGMPDSLDFSAMTGLLNDPIIKELSEQIATDPSFNQMAEQLQKTLQGAAVNNDGIPNFDTQQYYSTMQQVTQDPQFLTMTERLGSALMQGPAMRGMLENLMNPTNKDQLDERMSRLKEDLSLRPILDELENAGPAAMMRYWIDKDVLQKLGDAMGFPSGESAASAASEDEEESIILDTASGGGAV